MVSIVELKRFAARDLRDYPVLRNLILQEPDQIEASEFAVKVGLWLQVVAEERWLSHGVTSRQDRLAVGK